MNGTRNPAQVFEHLNKLFAELDDRLRERIASKNPADIDRTSFVAPKLKLSDFDAYQLAEYRFVCMLDRADRGDAYAFEQLEDCRDRVNEAAAKLAGENSSIEPSRDITEARGQTVYVPRNPKSNQCPVCAGPVHWDSQSVAHVKDHFPAVLAAVRDLQQVREESLAAQGCATTRAAAESDAQHRDYSEATGSASARPKS